MTTTSLEAAKQEQEASVNQPASGLELLIDESAAAIPTHVWLVEQVECQGNAAPTGVVLIADELFTERQLAATTPTPAEAPSGTTLDIDAWPIEVDLGQVPVSIDRETRSYLGHLPAPAVGTVIQVLRRWIVDTSDRVVKVDVSTFADPEDPDWLEVVFTLFVDSGPDETIRLWDDLAKLMAEKSAPLDMASREIVNSSLAFHVISKDDE